MKFTKIKLTNFRCFKSFEMEFNNSILTDDLKQSNNLHVIIAPNMVGKSALLKALRISIEARFKKIKVNLGSKRKSGISFNDHRVLGHNLFTDVSREVSIEVEVESKEWYKGKWDLLTIGWKKYKNDYQERTKIDYTTNNIAERADKSFNQAAEGNDGLNPLFLFVGTEYIHQQRASTKTLTQNGNAKQGYWYCLDESNMEKYVFDWFQKLYKTVLEQERSPISAKAYGTLPKKTLDNFKKAVSLVLPKVKMVDWIRNTLNETKEEYILIFDIEDEGLRRYDMLSDGYRYLILLVGELVTRASLLNKHISDNLLEQITGSVLIDEFGIHLHPDVQADTLSRISSTFPNLQFIVTTHSPLLINGLLKEQLYLLSEDKEGNRFINHPEEDAVGIGADGILLDIFGLTTTIDKSTKEQQERYMQLVKKKEEQRLSDDEQIEFNELNKILSKFRLDPTLLIEEDPITEHVKKRLAENSLHNNKSLSKQEVDDLEENIDSILDDLLQ